jgi:hypothetical protein
MSIRSPRASRLAPSHEENSEVVHRDTCAFASVSGPRFGESCGRPRVRMIDRKAEREAEIREIRRIRSSDDFLLLLLARRTFHVGLRNP